ncbi:glycosyltransferase [Salegentibacter sp. JZCK2]|uniref:glycosyltransferase family 2 protein n=1 Tax=Salegentibacter tibetensis TaxID=2873600 RepID=UPI001CCDEC09|nr:glycosyltransferase family 2 protein [Salegentibacter tibetensis]MBZ9730696.1 glycosyltransferase [Salegentibacter tibetensis]
MENPLVSVIMPAYNAENFIEDAVSSVISQSYSGWELFIIDDASLDSTLFKAEKLAKKDPRIKVLRNKQNSGAGITRNKGIKAAQGDFIAFLDADDQWKPKKLEMQLEVMQEQSAAVCFSCYQQIDENGSSRNEIIEALPILTYQKLLKSNYLGNLTGIYNAKKLGKIYSPEIRKRQDWALWLEAVKKGGPAIGIQRCLAKYRVRKGSISENKLEMLKYNFNIYHKVLGFNSLKSAGYMLVFLKEHFFVKSKQVKRI